MASLQKSLENPKFSNWVKAALALDFTKKALLAFVVKINKKSHNDAMGRIPEPCSLCDDVKSWETCPSAKPCKNKELKNTIKSLRAIHIPVFNNTTPKACWSEPWEFAKCFMPGKGEAHKKCKSADDTDVAGILSVMANNLDFQQELVQVKLTDENNIVKVVINVRNEVMHNPSFEVDDRTFEIYIKKIENLMMSIPNTDEIKRGRIKITELSSGTLTITTEDVSRCINEAVVLLQDQASELSKALIQMEVKTKQYKDDISIQAVEGKNQLTITITNGKMELESTTKKGITDIKAEVEHGKHILEDGRKGAAENVKQIANAAVDKLDKQKAKNESELQKKVDEGRLKLQQVLSEALTSTDECLSELRTEINSIINVKDQAGKVIGEIDSKAEQISQVTKKCAEKVNKVAQIWMEKIKEQSITKLAVSYHLDADWIRLMEGELAQLRDALSSAVSEMQSKKQYPFEHLDVTYQTETNCSITGMVKVDSNRLAIVDNTNKRVKIIDVHKNEIESSVVLDKDPWDIARVNEDQLVVSCAEMLQFLGHKDGKLTVDEKQISISCESKGIDVAGGKLAVTFPSPEKAVHIMNMDGEILNKIKLKQFEMPLSVRFGPGKQLYIADYDSEKVMCLDNEGSLEYPLTNNDMKGPHGLTIDDKGNVYISGNRSNSIHVIRVKDINPQLSKFLGENDGIERPQALTYCHIENKLYVSQTVSGTHIVSVHNGLNLVSPVDGDDSS